MSKIVSIILFKYVLIFFNRTTTVTTIIATSTSTTTVGAAPNQGRGNVAKRAANAACTGPTTVRPTSVPTYATSACGTGSTGSAQYASACSCKGQTQSVSLASTPTSTVSIAVVATPAICNNQGVYYYYYKDSTYHDDFNSPDKYGEFNPTKYDTRAPDAMGFTDSGTIGPIQYPDNGQDSTQIYGNTLQSHDYVVDHQTYFVAPIEGTYTFALSNIDDLAVLYTGSNAYNGYASGNEDYRAGYYYNSRKVVKSSHTLSQGQYFPLRLFYVNAPSRANLDFTVTGPAPYDQADSLKSFFVQSSCDGTTAPPFPSLPQGQSNTGTIG